METTANQSGLATAASEKVRFNFDFEEFKKNYLAEIANRATGEFQDETETLEKIKRWQTAKKAGLILAGDFGRGKTTIARAIYKTIYDKSQQGGSGTPVPLLATAKQIIGMFKNKVDAANKFFKYRNIFIDDLGKEDNVVNDYGTIETPMIDLFENRYDAMLPVVITTNLNREDIEKKYGKYISERLFETCEYIVFTGESFRK